DAASAYLEGALGVSYRAIYESHLAGCAACRRHLIELSRLAQSESFANVRLAAAPVAEANPAVAPDRISIWDRRPTWSRWKESFAAWFDVSAPSFKWRMAGATGAAFALLIGALGAQSWR